MTNDIYRKLSITAKIRRISSITASILRKKSITSKIDLQEIDVTLPTLQTAIVYNDFPTQIELLFDMALDDTSQPAYADFSVMVNGVEREVIGVSFSLAGTRVYVTTTAYSYGDVITVAYTQGSNPLRTATLLRVKSFTATAVDNQIVGSLAPVLQSVTVENATPTKIIHTFDLDLDESSVPNISDFAFSTKTGTGAVVVSGKTVTCTVTSRYYWGDSGGTSSYTKGANPIKSTGGGEAENFSSQAITNNCALDAATTTLITASRYTDAPTDALKALVNKTLVDYKATGLFAKRDCLYIRGVHEAVFACQNWIKNAHNSTLVNVPTFTAKQGFTGDGATSYINDNYKPFSQASTFTMDAACISFMDMTIGNANNKYSFGIAKASAPAYYCLVNFRTAANEQFYFNSAGALQDNVNQTNGDYMSYTRTGTSVQGYKNGSPSAGTDTVAASGALADWNFFELAGNSNGTAPTAHYNGLRSFLAIGGFLTAEEVAAEYTIIKYFFDNVNSTF